MFDHDHIRAAKASRYKELKIRVYETTSYLRVMVDVKPLNGCWCTFVPVSSVRLEKEDLDSLPASLKDIQVLVAEHLMGDAPLF